MARRQAVDPDEFFETANRLVAEGKEVTAKVMLDALGGGSLRTIYKFLEMWQEKRPAPISVKSSEVPDHVRLQYEASWKAAQQEAAREVEGVRVKAAEDVEAANKQFQEALDIADRLEKEAQEAAEQIAGLTLQVQELASKNQTLSAERATYKATSEQLNNQVEAHKQEIDRLERRSNDDKERHLGQVKSLEKQVAELKTSLEGAQTKATQFEKERDEAKAKAEEAGKQQVKAEEAAKKDRAERDTAIREAAEHKGKVETLKEQYAALMAKLSSEDKQSDRKGK